MKTPEDPQHLLERIRAGELDPEDPGVQAVAQRDPALRELIATYRQTQETLDRAGRTEREGLAAVRAPEGSVPAADIDALVRGLARRGGGRQPGARGFAALILGIAALVLIGLAIWSWPHGGSSQEPPTHLGGRLVVMPPSAAADGSVLLSWRLEAAAAAYYSALLRQEGDPRELARSPRLDRPEWNLPASLVTTLPTRIHLQVTAHDAAGDPVGHVDSPVSLPR
ncbi:MAG: hypothetical protein IT458_13200 [Planctomycetes bacterium]|nr:hypothetical protein [Planctomycetota bacterium]